MANSKTGPIKIMNADHTDLVSRYMILEKAYRALEKKYDKRVECSVAWDVKDFLDYDLDGWEINKKQAESALKDMIQNHSKNMGINWDVLIVYYEKWATDID